VKGPGERALSWPRRAAAFRAPDLLGRRDFRLLLGAQLVAQAADGAAQAGFADAILLDPGAQGTRARILAVFALTLLPYSLVAPFVGVFVDRWERKLLLVGSNVARALLLGALPLWAGSLPGDAALYVAVLVLLAFGRLFLTTKSAVLPVVLEEHDLLRGNAISGGGGMIAALLGGVVGLGLVAATRPAVGFVVAGLLYLSAALLARRIASAASTRPPHHETLVRAAGRVARELLAGLGEVWRRRPARLSLAGIFILRSAVMLTAIAAILVIRQTHPEAGDRVGRLSAGALALGISSVGAFVGALSVASFGRRLGNARLILFGFLVSGVGVATLGGIGDLRAVLLLTALGGYGAYVAKIATDAQVQEALPDAFRGRAFALYDILYNLASVCAAVVVVMAVETPLRAVLTAAGLTTLGLAALLGRAMGRAGMLRPPPKAF
jgi:MFS family permease